MNIIPKYMIAFESVQNKQGKITDLSNSMVSLKIYRLIQKTRKGGSYDLKGNHYS